MPRPVPVRRSLFLRLLALSLVVCAVSIGATAWLVARSIRADDRSPVQTVDHDRRVYEGLVAYTTDHSDWADVAPTLDALAADTGYRIVLTDADGGVVADSLASEGGAPGAAPIDPGTARTLLDPAHLDTSLLTPGTTAGAEAPCLAAGACPPTVSVFMTPARTGATTFFDLSAGNRLEIGLIVGGVLLAAAAASILIGRRMTRPLRDLATAAATMSTGDSSVRVGVRGGDEIAAVGDAFNLMAANRERDETARRQMIGDVAHELRTPLSNIRGHVEAAQDGLVSPDGELLVSLHEEALVLQQILDDLQDLALSDVGALRLSPEEVGLETAVEQATAAAGARAARGGVTVVGDVEPGLRIVADPLRLRQAIGNLVANAIRHTPGGTVMVAARAADADTVVIEVRDTGSGIRPDDLPHVFDRLWRADQSRTRATGGSGLGLAIVKSIVELHGGSVSAESALGVGSTFRLSLPRAAVSPEPAEPALR